MKPADWLAAVRYLSLATGLGLSFISPVLLSWWLGAFLQARLGGSGWFVLSLLVGVAAGLTSAYFLLKQLVPWE